MVALKRTGGALAVGLVIAALPFTAASAEHDSGPLEVALDHSVVTLGDEVELEVDWEVDGPLEPVTVTFDVDFGDGSEPISEAVDAEVTDDEAEAELEVDHIYEAVGSYEIKVSATVEGGAAAVATVHVEITDDTVPYPRPGRNACPEVDDEAESDHDESEPESDDDKDGSSDREEAPASAEPGVATQGISPHVFDDVVPASTHGRFVSCLARAGLFSGVAPGTFAPGRSVTREQLATLLVKALERSGIDLPEGDDAFDDDDGSVHEAAINALVEAGLVSGTGNGTFNPGAPVTRVQMATFLTSLYETIVGTPLDSDFDYFDDDEQTVHEDNINEAAKAGFAAGRASRAYGPDGEVTREQIATFLSRVIDRLVTEDAITL